MKAKIKRLTKLRANENLEPVELSFTVSGSADCQSHFGKLAAPTETEHVHTPRQSKTLQKCEHTKFQWTLQDVKISSRCQHA